MNGDNSKGVFVVIEGPDASGKETQTGLLTEWLRESDYSDISEETQKEILEDMPGDYPDPDAEKVKDSIENGVWRLSFPTYSQTPGGRVIEAYLDGRFGDREDLTLEEKIDIFAADRKQFRSLIREFISEGGVIVCDRYREANLILHLTDFTGKEWRDKLEYIKGVDSDLPDPDEVFYLDISPEEASRRMSGKDKDIHELDDSYMKKSNENGKKVAEHESWNIIDGERPRQKVFESLKQAVESHFST